MGPPRSNRISMPAPEDYFRGVSPLCRRILEDMARVREKYGENWEDLSYQEQCKILDQTIVDEATVRRYETGHTTGPGCEYFPKLKLSTGQKIVSDEKLSARGYSCSWRDEHSAPFSWHTRSQMDLTLETPPPTPTQSLTSPKEMGEYTDEQDKSKLTALASLPPPLKSFKATPFLWHYDPHPDAHPPESPDLVVASSLTRNSSKGGSTPSLFTKGTSFNHMVVRLDNRGNPGFLGWFRGALSAITGICLPLHSCAAGEGQKGTLLHPSSPFIHPELRPPHVIAKAAKVPITTMAQPPKAPSAKKSESYNRLRRDSTLKSECPSIETTLTYDLNSDKGSHTSDDTFKGSYNQNLNSSGRMPICNRNSFIYGTFTEEDTTDDSEFLQTRGAEFNDALEDIIFERSIRAENASRFEQKRDLDEENNPKRKDAIEDNASTFDIDEELPLINLSIANENIPKTGFDFLDNW